MQSTVLPILIRLAKVSTFELRQLDRDAITKKIAELRKELSGVCLAFDGDAELIHKRNSP